MKDDSAKLSGKHPCDRVCVAGAAPMECSYTFNVELYNTLAKACYDCPLNITDCDREHCISADGAERGLITVNRWDKPSYLETGYWIAYKGTKKMLIISLRQMPGPTVVVCQGDTVVAEIVNKLHTETTTIHWHGNFFSMKRK